MALRPREPSTSWGRALDLGMQFGGSVVVGLALGYYLDRWLGTEPLLLIVFMLFGFAAGLRTLLRFAQRAVLPPDSHPPGASGSAVTDASDGEHSDAAARREREDPKP